MDWKISASSIAIILLSLLIKLNISSAQTINDHTVIVLMYTLLAIGICALLFALDKVYNIYQHYSLRFGDISFIFSIVLIILINIVPGTNQLVKNTIWVALIIILGLSLIPMYSLSVEQGLINTTMVSMGLILLGVLVVIKTYPNSNYSSLGNYLLAGLLGLLVFMLVYAFNEKQMPISHATLGGIGIGLFSGFLLYDIGKLSGDISQDLKTWGLVDYPDKTISIFLDLINLFNFTNIVQMKN